MNSRSIVTVREQPGRTSQAGSPTLIDRFTGRLDHATNLHYDLPDREGFSLRLVDTSRLDDADSLSPPGHASLWHVLWCQEEASAATTISTDTSTETWPIAPGDSLLVPSTATFSATGGQLALTISTVMQTSASDSLSPPTHGTERLSGYNRQTTYPDLHGVETARWKITQPLDLAMHHPVPFIVVSLAGDPVISTPSESITLRRGKAAMVQGTEPVTVFPNGLAYLFVISETEGRRSDRVFHL